VNRKYIVRLTEEERVQLTELVNNGQAAAYKIKHANVLQKVDADGQNWCDVQTAEAFSCRARTVSNLLPTLCWSRGLRRPWDASRVSGLRENRFWLARRKRA